MQEYVQEQEKDLTTDINNASAKELLVEKDKSAAEKRLSYERAELYRNQNELRSAEKSLHEAIGKEKVQQRPVGMFQPV